ncbi:MAG: hypothetical protein OEZ04_11470 [Nitrospinota bacterium]|nr:hypothetical protein [Nitrospinota bacterium]
MRIPVIVVMALALLAADSHAKWPWSGGANADGGKKAEKMLRSAKGAYGSADYSKTVQLCDDILKTDPNNAAALALRGKAKKDLGDVDAATADLDQAIKLDPKLGEAYYIRAQVHEIMGEMDQAEAGYQKACKSGFKSACR